MDFTDGTTWFVAGLCLTILVAVAYFVILAIAALDERRRGI